MPTLNQYAESSDKSGTYIRANVGGDTPITLQVSALADRLFRLLDYTPQEELPSKLVWNMYDVGLVYTLNSLTSLQETNSANNPSGFLEQLDLDSSLSAEEQDEIVRQLKEYEGPDPEKVQELIDRLQGPDTNPAQASNLREAVPLLLKWANNPAKYDQLCDTVKGYKEFAAASIQTFARHLHLESPPIWLRNDGTIRYELSHEKYSQTVCIWDCRILTTKHDYKVTIEHSNDGLEVAEATSTGHITNYEDNAGRRGN